MRLGPTDPFDLVGPSFSALLHREAPEMLAGRLDPAGGALEHVDGTTIVGLTFGGDGGDDGDGGDPTDTGVVVAADRRGTMGSTIANRDMRKVFPADAWSAVGIAGSAGPAVELARLFATELEYYEKVERNPLSLEGKANKLGQMVRANLPLAMQGLVVVPLFAGYDLGTSTARIYEYDVTGGRFDERRFATNGSGGRDARGSLKARFRAGLDRQAATDMAIEALWDAADEDSATGGPDLVRGIYPLVAVIDRDGYREIDDDDVAARVEQVIAARRG